MYACEYLDDWMSRIGSGTNVPVIRMGKHVSHCAGSTRDAQVFETRTRDRCTNVRHGVERCAPLTILLRPMSNHSDS